MEKKYSRSPFTIICYVLSALMLVYVFYTVGSTISYLSSYFAAYGTTLSQNFGDAFSYIISSVIQPLSFAVIMFMAGLILDEVRKQNDNYYLSADDAIRLAAAKAAKKAAKASAKAEKKSAKKEAEVAVDVASEEVDEEKAEEPAEAPAEDSEAKAE